MLKKIFIYGASGHGKVIADIAQVCGYTHIVFVDDGKDKYLNFEEIQNELETDIIVAIGDNLVRKRVLEKIEKFGFQPIVLIHPSAIISPSVSIGLGTVIMPNVVVNADAKIGKGVIINSGSIIEHECSIEEYVHISPSVALAGNVSIGKCSHMGIHSTAIQNVSIGDNVIVGAGSVVLKHVENNLIVVGNPAKFLRRNHD